jgi:hypothetical protein
VVFPLGLIRAIIRDGTIEYSLCRVRVESEYMKSQVEPEYEYRSAVLEYKSEYNTVVLESRTRVRVQDSSPPSLAIIYTVADTSDWIRNFLLSLWANYAFVASRCYCLCHTGIFTIMVALIPAHKAIFTTSTTLSFLLLLVHCCNLAQSACVSVSNILSFLLLYSSSLHAECYS